MKAVMRTVRTLDGGVLRNEHPGIFYAVASVKPGEDPRKRLGTPRPPATYTSPFPSFPRGRVNSGCCDVHFPFGELYFAE